MKEDFQFVRQCILSSNNEFQFDCCNELIKLFSKKHFNDTGMMDDRFALLSALEEKKHSVIPMPRITEEF